MIQFQNFLSAILAFCCVFFNHMSSLQQTIGTSPVQSNSDLDIMKLEPKIINSMQNTFLSLVFSRTKKLEHKYNTLLSQTDKCDIMNVDFQNLTARIDQCQDFESLIKKIISRIENVEGEVEILTKTMKDVGTIWETYNGINYYFSSDAVQWEEAQMNCQKLGKESRLASIPSQSVNSFLIRNGKNDVYWTGGTDKYTEGRWVWNDQLLRITYTDWRPGEPSNSDGKGPEHCLLLYTDPSHKKHWNDARCVMYFRYICESNDN